LGIVFSPFVKHDEGGFQVPRTDYTFAEVEVMLKVTNTRFHFLATYGMGVIGNLNLPTCAITRNYIKQLKPNHCLIMSITAPQSKRQTGTNRTICETNHEPICWTAEAVAKINRDRSTLAFRTLIGAFHTADDIFITELNDAFDVAKKANAIYPETVHGIIFSSDYVTGPTQASEIDKLLLQYRSEADENNLMIGIRTDRCSEFRNGNASIAFHILMHSDFIICIVAPNPVAAATNEMEAVVKSAGKMLTKVTKWIHDIQPSVLVFGQSVWASDGGEWYTIHNMAEYWAGINDWAVQNEFLVFMTEAIDNPWKKWTTNAAYEGWWHLRLNNETLLEDGYVQKIDGMIF